MTSVHMLVVWLLGEEQDKSCTLDVHTLPNLLLLEEPPVDCQIRFKSVDCQKRYKFQLTEPA
jgi:hypothetical protein